MDEPETVADLFPIVGIGASAGGLDAFTQLLRNLPADTGMAFVLIQHLDPTHASLLSEILNQTSLMPVKLVEDGMKIAPNCVYAIPPNTCMTLDEGKLKLKPRPRDRVKNMPIDLFFKSLASEWGSRAIAIVLSGSDADGSLGLSAVKSAGGITFAQEPRSCEFPHMPQSAISTGCVDFILPPATIAAELVKIGCHPYLKSAGEPQSYEPSNNGEALSGIFALLRSSMGVDFTHYKQGTLKRRIMRRMVLHNVQRLGDYLRYLQDNPTEVEGLYHDLLIGVTSFFREPDTFEALKKTVFPQISQNKSFNVPIRIWIPACSTGQEAYSIAISLLEFFGERAHKPPIQIFATDISELAIERARLGTYPASLLTEVTPERLRRFFVEVEGGYQIAKAVRELCVFARQDLIGDPPFSRLDLISCRNVLIYLEPSLQKNLMPVFHYALKPNGFLMLGTSESISEFSDLFAVADKKSRIYSRKLAATRFNFNFIKNNSALERDIALPANPSEPLSDLDLDREADRIVLSQYAPVGVIINSDFEILQFRGQTSPYLEPAPGKASLNLLKMARAELALELRTAIHRAKQQAVAVRKAGIQLQVAGNWLAVNLEVIPIERSPSDEETPRYWLVLFDSQPTGAPEPPQKSSKARPAKTEREINRLKEELATTKEYLQSIIEAQESSNQDLKVANEEILSSNEELQSTNEELETAKEEIQATNEELSTINEELRSRNLQMNQINSDLQNLLTSVKIPILIVGGDLRIRRFTPIAEQLFSLITTDVGRPLSDIQPNISIPNLSALAIASMDTLQTHEQEVQDRDGHWYSLRIRPYKTIDDRIDGVVISAVDIDALKRSAILLEASYNYSKAIVETVRSPLVVLNANLEVVRANQSFYRLFQMVPERVEKQSIFQLGDGEWEIPRLRALLEDILPHNNPIHDFEVSQEFASLGQRVMLLNACRIEEQGVDNTILVTIEDITVRKGAEAQRETSLQEKEILLREIRHRVKNNLQVISSLLSLQSNRVGDVEARKILEDSQNRVQTMSLMHELWYQSTNLAEIDLDRYIHTLVHHLFQSYCLRPDAIAPSVSVPQHLTLDPDRAVLCGLIINELVTNAFKYGFPNGESGEVSVSVEQDNDSRLTLSVSHNGDRLPANFSLEGLQSVGLNLVINLASQLNGNLYLERGKKTIFKVVFTSAI